METIELPVKKVAKPTRGRRSREQTRRKLIDAALRVMAVKGVDGTAISDITEAADVGLGSFYNHFKTKSEVAQAAFTVHAEKIGELTKLVSRQEPDPAVAIAYIQKMFVTKAVADPVWGWFVIHAAAGIPELWTVFAPQGTQHMKMGVEAGRFSNTCYNTAMRTIIAAMLSTMRALLDGDVKATAGNEHIECMLRMLGVDGDEARALSRRRLPSYIDELFDAATIREQTP